ncbi:PREDICTED: LETM1 domain-containing protein LETM2, mitochondrial isoform X2 [Trachymyrmex septentrionalis]|uniref:LETM1 domain-containing protein LETM2, mitochondrial isoform X2 n=1 Tax=Trachymyrmex septentrionalis TaxID=34720 RepID=UPI00084F7A02|nr:PREDICTED: LETM1 domain-containing protein LETM2, mitochondrial isoform X2 [Trachymyrmex septentrionalis]
MNTLIHTKMIAGHGGVIVRRYSPFKLWYNTNHTMGSISLTYTRLRDPRRLLLEPTVLPMYINNKNMTCLQIRTFYVTPSWNGQEPSSKIEETVKNIKEEKELQNKTVHNVAMKNEQPKKAVAKVTIWQKIKGEILHYYHGFRLLGLDMKVSAKLIWRILHGKSLSRREHRLLIKTTGDMFRLIPFSVFIIVPFMEFLLPVAIKLFPGMLPSTFQTAVEKEDKLKQALKVKIEMAKFLQKTLDEMALQSSDHKSEKAKEFAEFFYKVRTGGTVATNEEIMKFSKVFEDEITLDSLSRPQLIALCRVLDVQTLGTTNFLKFLLRMRLRSLTADDKLIEKEGVESLTRAELQQACRARGMRAYGLPESRLKEQLSQWLDLSIIKKVPPSLLLLSRALMIPETMPMSDKLKATISALPDTVVARTKGAIGEKEGKVDHRTNIEIIKMEERKIEEERKEKKEAEPQPSISESSTKIDEITTTDVKVLEQALDSIDKDNKTMAVQKEEIKELKEEMAEYQEDIKELYQIKAEAKGQTDIENIKISKGANRLFKKVNKMISKMDAVLLELEQSEKKVKQRLESLGPDEKKDTKDVEELVKIDELVATIKQIQNVPDEHRLKRIAEILGKIDDDQDGAIKIEDVLKVVELIGKEDVNLSKEQVDELIELMDKEEVLEVEEQIQKTLEKNSKTSQTEKNIKATHKSTVPATPVTTEPGYGKEELVDDAARECSKTYGDQNIEEDKQKSTVVLKSNSKSDEIKNPPITSGVQSTAKKAEGSKQL